MIKLSRPLLLLLAALNYLLGTSVADYLGYPFRAESFWLGFAGIVLAQIGMNLLTEVFRPHNEPLIEDETPAQKESLRNNMLYVSIAALTADAVIAFLLYFNNRLEFSALYFLLISLLLVIAYAVPPLRFVNRGFGELTLAAHIAYIIPAVGFLLQADEYHQMLFFITLPLTFLAFAYFLILDFPSFAFDQKYQRVTLLRRLTWERAVPLHHSAVVIAYALFLFAAFTGLSFHLLWPAFLTLPFAILQIVLLRHISLGGKPNWTLLTVTALAVFGLTSYFLTLTLRLR